MYKQVSYAMKYTTGYYRDLLCNPMAHMLCAVISYKHFLMPNFADGKVLQCTNHILSRPASSTPVAETVVWWETEMIEVESGSQWS